MELAQKVALQLGDPTGLPPVRTVLADGAAEVPARRAALVTLVAAKDRASSFWMASER